LAKSEIIERKFVMVARGNAVEEEVKISQPKNPDLKWLEDFWEDFRNDLRLDDSTQPWTKKPCRTTNFSFYLPPGSDKAWISAYIARSKHDAGVYLAFGSAFEEAESVFNELLDQRENIEREIGVPLKWNPPANDKRPWVAVPTVQFGNLNIPADRQRVIAYLADYSNRMVNAFRHRLDKLTREF
jgi:hypothetical protein